MNNSQQTYGSRVCCDDIHTLVWRFVFILLRLYVVSKRARPTDLLDIYHSVTPKKYEKALDFVFCFLKKNLVQTKNAKVVMARKGYNSCESSSAGEITLSTLRCLP
jgi:hypothetical protein